MELKDRSNETEFFNVIMARTSDKSYTSSIVFNNEKGCYYCFCKSFEEGEEIIKSLDHLKDVVFYVEVFKTSYDYKYIKVT